MYDDASSRASKKLVELSPITLPNLVEPHVGCSFYLFASTVESLDKEKASDMEFSQNGTIWQKVLYGNLKRTDQVIKLDSFYLFEWFPRCPGLYYTENARIARSEAARNIISTENGMIVYDPYGKMTMLDGGIGSIRLLPIQIEGSSYYLMSASSTEICDQGFPVAVPENLYNKFINQILEKGAVPVDLWGKMIVVPKTIRNIYTGYKGVPKMLLKIDDIRNTQMERCQNEALTVNVAVSFESNFDGRKSIYASYVSFDPSSSSSFQESVEWLEEDYVGQRYKGRIITDFDETMEHFKNASFSLSKVMNFQVKSKDFQDINPSYDFKEYIHIQNVVSNQYTTTIIQKMEKNQNINVSGGQIGALGDGAIAQNFTQNQTIADKEIDLQQLVEELSRLRNQAKTESSTLEHDSEIGTLAGAEAAARAGDKPKVLELLSKAGKWTLDIATKIGTGLVVSILKDNITGK